ncbi:MAG: class I SAM-dependent methyltransferase [Phycisphaeraceae bacterium]|nr:MAG: class I SAM-dependent methyltransferase [Phycisphaeraceae bacterium]
MPEQTIEHAAPPTETPTDGSEGAFHDEQASRIYPPGVERHWWSRARNAIIARHLGRLLDPEGAHSAPVIEIGCGTGVVIHGLRERGFDATGVDLLRGVPATPDVAPHVHFETDAFDLPARDRYRAVLLCDVLEHIAEPAEFLRQIRAHFPEARRMLVTLPARMEVWSNYDEYYGHYLRYDLRSLRALAAEAGANVEYAGYFFHGLWPFARAFKLLGRQRGTTMAAPSLSAAGLHGVVAAAFDLESRLVPRTIRGLSLLGTLRFDADTPTSHAT